MEIQGVPIVRSYPHKQGPDNHTRRHKAGIGPDYPGPRLVHADARQDDIAAGQKQILFGASRHPKTSTGNYRFHRGIKHGLRLMAALDSAALVSWLTDDDDRQNTIVGGWRE